MKLDDIITEATRSYKAHPVLDMALMPFQEYVKIANQSGKSHPSHAYDVDTKKLNSYHTIKEYPILINRFTSNGIAFELREKRDDRHKMKYAKKDSNGDIVYDENGRAMLLSAEEIKKMLPGKYRWEIQHAIYDIERKVIAAATSDEWGTLLVQVAREYRRFGLGTKLIKYHRNIYPTKDSGGFTIAGYENIARVWDKNVREYMANGFYSYLVRTNRMTMAQAKKIIAGLDKRPPIPKKINLSTSNPNDWAFHLDGGTCFCYDRKLFDLDEFLTKDTSGYWEDNFIIGYFHIIGSSESRVYRWYGKNDKIKVMLAEMMLGEEGANGILFQNDDADFILNNSALPLQTGESLHKNETLIFLEKQHHPIAALNTVEKKYRLARDQYDEKWYKLQELAYQVGEEKGR